jgi:hypothetical protein
MTLQHTVDGKIEHRKVRLAGLDLKADWNRSSIVSLGIGTIEQTRGSPLG